MEVPEEAEVEETTPSHNPQRPTTKGTPGTKDVRRGVQDRIISGRWESPLGSPTERELTGWRPSVLRECIGTDCVRSSWSVGSRRWKGSGVMTSTRESEWRPKGPVLSLTQRVWDPCVSFERLTTVPSYREIYRPLPLHG